MSKRASYKDKTNSAVLRCRDKRAVWALALEDRAASVDACLSEWPDKNEAETSAWLRIMRIDSLLFQYNMKLMSVANTAAKHIVDNAGYPTFEVWAMFVPTQITLDVLAVTGSDFDVANYLERIKAHVYRTYGCRDAFVNEEAVIIFNERKSILNLTAG